MEDNELISKYIEGDEAAFSELVERHAKSVYRFVHRMTKNDIDVEDIVQETFVKIWKNMKKFKKDQNFRVWLFAIARNTAIDWLRKRKHLVFSDFDASDGGNVILETLADSALLADEIFSQIEDVKALEKILEKLPPVKREVLMMRHGDDLTFAEMAAILGKSIDTVKSTYRRALIEVRLMVNAGEEYAPK